MEIFHGTCLIVLLLSGRTECREELYKKVLKLSLCSSVELKIRDYKPRLYCAYGYDSRKVSLINKSRKSNTTEEQMNKPARMTGRTGNFQFPSDGSSVGKAVRSTLIIPRPTGHPGGLVHLFFCCIEDSRLRTSSL